MNCKALIVGVAILCAAFSASAAVLTVTSLADSGAGSLRNQVTASSAGDSIQFGVNGTILLNAAINVPHTLYVYGPGPSALVVDANHVDRAFVTGGAPVLLYGMTITNGFVIGTQGADGAIFHDGLPGGDAYGGAILNSSNSDSLILSNCWITGNTVEGGQGGRGGDDGPSALLKPPGHGGMGGRGIGGALYATGNVIVANCTFSRNRAVGGSGGAGGNDLSSNSIPGITGGTGGDGGLGQGGAVDEIDSGSISGISGFLFDNSTFSANRVGGGAAGKGGDSPGNAGGQGGNGSAGGGGAIATVIATFRCCTIVSNSAFDGSGGLGGNGVPHGANGSPGGGTAGGVIGYGIVCLSHVTNTIIADNFAETSCSNYFIAFVDGGYNFIGSKDYTLCPFGAGSMIGTIPAPLHPQLGPLAQNGGGLPTHATLTTSPVTDAGNSFGLTTDERGAPRPHDFNSIPNFAGGDGSDMGAFELGAADVGLGKSGGNVVVSWAAYYGDFILQFTTNMLVPGAWSSVTDPPVVVGNLLMVTNNPVGASKFYRLISR